MKGGDWTRPASRCVHLKGVPQLLHKLVPPVLHPLSHESFQRGDVDGLHAGVRAKHPEHGELSRDCLARPGGRTNKDVRVGVVDSVEDLGLYRVEVVEFEDSNQVVGYGETGRVKLTTLTKELFVPGFLERDEGEREPPFETFPWDGLVACARIMSLPSLRRLASTKTPSCVRFVASVVVPHTCYRS